MRGINARGAGSTGLGLNGKGKKHEDYVTGYFLNIPSASEKSLSLSSTMMSESNFENVS
jgi:hypothetical protein